MDSYLVYYDESGDDGVIKSSSDDFVLTALHLPMNKWQDTYNKILAARKEMQRKYGFPFKEEMHTACFLYDKKPYRDFGWSVERRREIVQDYLNMILGLDIKITNIIIDKPKIKNKNDYDVLTTALKYSIQRIENTSHGQWNYLIISDEGRVGTMRKTARKIRQYNPIPTKFSNGSSRNLPIKLLVEDVLSKNSNESYFIQICDFISYFVHLHFKCNMRNAELPGRVNHVIVKKTVETLLDHLKSHNILNLRANQSNKYGFVIYPK